MEHHNSWVDFVNEKDRNFWQEYVWNGSLVTFVLSNCSEAKRKALLWRNIPPGHFPYRDRKLSDARNLHNYITVIFPGNKWSRIFLTNNIASDAHEGESQWKSLPMRSVVPSRGGGVLPYVGFVSMCRCEGYGFQAVYPRIGYINQSVWV